MAFSRSPLLIHSEAVPLHVREAMRVASSALPEVRNEKLAAAAHLLHRETGLDCRDVRELLGLRSGD